MPAKRTRVPRDCSHCETTFPVKPSDIAKGGGKFCSQECRAAASGLTLADKLRLRVQRGPGCWDWQGTTDRDGYGLITLNGQQVRAHRLAWEVATDAPVPDGWLIGHTCDRPVCTRNDEIGTYEVEGVLYERRGHLWLATLAANSADMTEKRRGATGDRNGSRLHPERLKRGDANGSRLHPERLMRGERVNTAKLTAAQVVEIRARRANGEPAKALAAEYNVHKNLIWLIGQGKAWKHVT